MNNKKIFVAALAAIALSGGIFFSVNAAYASFYKAPDISLSSSPAQTGSATSVTAADATLRGMIDARGAKTNFWFEYGTDPSLATSTSKVLATDKAAAGRGASLISFATDIAGLNPKTQYYFRIVAESSLGTVRGDIASFQTR